MLKVIENFMQGVREWCVEFMRVYRIYTDADKMGYDVRFLVENDNGQFLANMKMRRRPYISDEKALVLSNSGKALGNFSGFDNWVMIG